MDFMTTKDAAEKWGVTVRRVQGLCEQGLVEGVERLGDIWVMPKSAQKPLDGRTLEAKRMRFKSAAKTR